MSSTTDRDNRITDEEQTRMGATTESNASEHINDQEELMIVDLYLHRVLRRRKLWLIRATCRVASGAFLAWAGLHYFQAGVIEPWLNANGPWYWFGFGVLAALLLNELADALLSFNDALDWFSAVHWWAGKVKAMPPAEQLREVPARELAAMGIVRPPHRTTASAGESR